MNRILILFFVLVISFSASVGIVHAATIITLDSDVIIIGDLNVLGEITGTTIGDLDSRITILEGGGG